MKAIIKYSTVLAIAVISMTTNANAQHFNIGIKGGANFFNVINDGAPNYSTRTSVHVGLLSHIHIDRSIALQPELVYSSQGGKYKINGVDHTLRLGYINVPVLLQYMFDNGFRLEAGPQLGFLVNADSKSNGNSVKVKESFKTVDFGVAIGVGYVKPSTGFGVDIRYNAGLSNINENSAVKSTNSGFQAGVFYLFGHK